MKINTRSWLLVSLLNLSIVALIGAVMRYKIGFSFPHFDQKNLQHAHSHFAFIGWVTHTLFVLMVHVLQRDRPETLLNKYRWIFILNLVCAYGMLISFAVSGYSGLSIGLSTASIFIGYLFAFYFFKDMKSLGKVQYKYWFSAGLWFNIISSVGTFTLALMMASHNFNQKVHLASLYYYLHFQYNGFFFFVCMGLFLASLNNLGSVAGATRIFWLFFISCIPAYFLSVLWMKLPIWLYIVIVLSAVLQVVAWIGFLKIVRKNWLESAGIYKTGKYVFLIIAAALTIKFTLQLGSTVPYISKLAFGFRPIIIAYLHLILLAIISVFLINFMYTSGLIKFNKLMLASIIVFVFGVYLNELILGIQGVASFFFTSVPFANQLLVVASVLIFISIVLLLFSQRLRLPLINGGKD